jgi:hypothetical protein
MKMLYKSFTIQDSKVARGVIDGVDIHCSSGGWVMYKPTLDDAKKAIDKWTGNSVKIEERK